MIYGLVVSIYLPCPKVNKNIFNEMCFHVFAVGDIQLILKIFLNVETIFSILKIKKKNPMLIINKELQPIDHRVRKVFISWSYMSMMVVIVTHHHYYSILKWYKNKVYLIVLSILKSEGVSCKI